MANLTIEKYFAENHKKWLRRARNLCYQYSVSCDNAEDILHDAICVVCEKNSEQDLIVLLSTQIPPYTLLDLWISRATSYKVMNFGVRVKRIRSKKTDTDVNLLNIIDDEHTPHYDVYEQQQYLSKAISEMETDDWTKRILLWRIVENNPLQRFRGTDNHKIHSLYHMGVQQLQGNI